MVVKRIAACLLLLTLAGCYRQSEDSFAPINTGGESQITPLAPTELPPVIDPTLDTTPLVPDGETPTVMIIIPTDDEGQPTTDTTSLNSDATATIVIFEQPTKAAPTDENLFSNVPTATIPAVITPILGNPVMVTIAPPTSTSATPSTPLIGNTPGSDLQPTPTDLPLEGPGECDYTIVAGDTLFRISLREDVTLEDLLAANDLTESSIIQPGQVITIPDCEVEAEPTTALATNTLLPDTFLPTPTGVTTTGGTPGTSGSTGATQLYKVQPGDTLSKIAADFGVSVEAIVDANDLANPNRLSIGQELKIPK